MKLSRADRSLFAEWAFTVDRGLLSAFFLLLAVGLVLSFAASPAVAIKKGLDTYYFVERHVVFAALSTGLMAAVSLMTPTGVRRLSFAIFLLSLAGMAFVLATGSEVNGAQRWLSVAGYSLQPSEFAKPAFVVLLAWLFAEATQPGDMPALTIAIGLWGAFAGLLIAQPDVGQTVLVSVTAGLLFLLAGLPLVGALGLAALGGVGLWVAYQHFSHVQLRLDRFFNPMPLENYQVNRAMQSFTEGGFLGRGPGEGTIKSVLPDAHTDFILAVVAEEYGVVACLGLLAIFVFVVVRALRRANIEGDLANRLAIQGLAIVFGLQAIINMGVNVGLLPPKGMTLPFISAGGSSMLALAITAGMLLAMTRRRADPQRLKKPRLVPTIDSAPLGGAARGVLAGSSDT